MSEGVNRWSGTETLCHQVSEQRYLAKIKLILSMFRPGACGSPTCARLVPDGQNCEVLFISVLEVESKAALRSTIMASPMELPAKCAPEVFKKVYHHLMECARHSLPQTNYDELLKSILALEGLRTTQAA